MEDDVKKENDAGGGPASASDHLARLEKEREEYLEGWKRAKADFINYKKDEIKRFGEFSRFAAESLVRELIAVLDSFALALESEPVRLNEVSGRGLYLIRQQLEDILRQYGLRRVEVKAGDAFDPALHEAIAEVEFEKPAGTIVEVLGQGYFLHDKLIRPARVKVAK